MTCLDQLQNPHLEGGPIHWKAGPVGILLFHGFGATTAEVRPLGTYLNNHGYSIAAPLLPGHGTSTSDINTRRWQEWLDAGESAYQCINNDCETVFVAGESMGGLVAINLAVKHKQIAGLMLFAPALQIRYAWVRWVATILSPFAGTIRKPASAASPGDDLWQGYKVYALKAMKQLFSFQAYTRQQLHAVGQPVLIISGKNDRSVHPQVPDYLAKHVTSTQIELHRMEQSGHCVVLDAEKEAVFETCLDFIHRQIT